MLEGRCRAQSCRPRRLKVTAGSPGSLPRTPLTVWTTTFTLFLLRLTSRFRDVNGSRFFLGGASCGFPRRKNVVTRTLRWSGVRMEQPDPRHFASSQPQSRSAYAREHVSSGLAQRNLRSRRGASARGFHHFPGQPCSFRRDCAYASGSDVLPINGTAPAYAARRMPASLAPSGTGRRLPMRTRAQTRPPKAIQG
jgi:hypothetical protein